MLVVITTGISFLDGRSNHGNTAPERRFEAGVVSPPVAAREEGHTLTHTDEKEEEGGGEIKEESTFPPGATFIEPQQIPVFPIRNWDVKEPDLPARAALVLVSETKQNLYTKDIHESLPIASITKLMTALVVLDHAKLDDRTVVSRDAIATEGEAGNLVVGEEITIQNLLLALLIESSNDAAIVLGEYFDSEFAPKTLVEEMNKKAVLLGLHNSHFRSPSGLDFENEPSNVSTAEDVARLMQVAWTHSFIRDAVRIKLLTIYSADGRYIHYLGNSNRLLGGYSWMLGGKTGYTEIANESLVSVVESPSGKGSLIIVVLKTDDRARDTQILMDWVTRAYIWE